MDEPASRVVLGTPRNPAYLFGIWRWYWARTAAIHLVLHPDGRAEKYLAKKVTHRKGAWKVSEDGTLHVSFADDGSRIRFRIDGKTSLMDLATIRTDRDFPWEKVERIVAQLGDDQ